MLYCINLNIDIKHENELIRNEDPMNDSKWHILDLSRVTHGSFNTYGNVDFKVYEI